MTSAIKFPRHASRRSGPACPCPPRLLGVAVAGWCPLVARALHATARCHAHHGPPEVRILFGGEIERAFSTIEVTDSAGHRVDKGNARVDEKNRQLLRVGLGPLSPGVYRVLWRILAVDGHRNEGTYVFTVKP